MAESDEARQWHSLVRAAVRECLETWRLQVQDGQITEDALEGILGRSAFLLLRRLDGQPPELIVDPILVRTMLAAFLEVLAEQRQAGRT